MKKLARPWRRRQVALPRSDALASRNVARISTSQARISTPMMISEPKRVEAIYAKLPKNKLKQIDQRDGTPAALIEALTTKGPPETET
ncbi:hypothetical protein [Defluviimonas sp. SAOS-178_SWC]|uniref:hypothetical protein n=1 Tax=Defluviimonas sp. SAOS-178_SWC TaxID=3121287 RepID=UPI003221E835